MRGSGTWPLKGPIRAVDEADCYGRPPGSLGDAERGHQAHPYSRPDISEPGPRGRDAEQARHRQEKDAVQHENQHAAELDSRQDYWRQFYFLLEDAGLNVELVNAKDARNLPGRKTDVSDAAWLAQLGAHGLVRGALVPPADIRRIRDLNRARTAITDERSREIQRLEKMLEDSGIKLSAVATDIVGVSGRAMLEALISGEDDPKVLADLAKTRMRSKIPVLVEALTGRFNDHHAFMARLYLDRIDAHSADLGRVDARLQQLMAPFRGSP